MKVKLNKNEGLFSPLPTMVIMTDDVKHHCVAFLWLEWKVCIYKYLPIRRR